jgi:hypothetical protein
MKECENEPKTLGCLYGEKQGKTRKTERTTKKKFGAMGDVSTKVAWRLSHGLALNLRNKAQRDPKRTAVVQAMV